MNRTGLENKLVLFFVLNNKCLFRLHADENQLYILIYKLLSKNDNCL